MSISTVRSFVFLLLFGAALPALAAAPNAITTAASGLTSSSAVLNGSGSPNGEATTGRFRYSATNPGTCNDTFGTRVPAASGTDLGNGSAQVPYSITTTGLSPGVTYYFCAIVSNGSGTAFGSILSFTIPSTPVVVTSPASSITSSSVTLQGAANPVAAATTSWFRYATVNPGGCNDTFGIRTPSSGGASLGSGISSVPYTQPLGGLSPATTYYYCAIANNSYGNGFGTVVSFTTPAMAPTVSTYAASNLSRTGGTLNGYVNPGGADTTAWFRYSSSSPGTCNDTFGTRAPSTGGSALGTGSSTIAYAQNVSGLVPATTYYYCAIASNAVGTSWGSVLTFITPSPPTAVTTAPTSISNTTASLNGTGNPNRASTNGWFRYALTNPGTCDDKFGSRAPVTGGLFLGSDIGDQPYSQAISGLSGSTTYYYCAIVSSSEGTAFGTVLTFVTSGPATATTAAATTITSTSATLNGSGNPNGATTVGWYRYSATNPGSCNDSFGSRTPSYSGTALGASNSNVAFAQPIGGLSPSTTYYFCALTSNSYGTGFGAVLTFTTPAMAPTVSTYSASSLTRTTGVLNGYINPGGADTTGWFRYSTASPGTCNDSFGTRAPTTGGSALGAGSSTTAFAQAITGLAPATTYYYCALASNAIGTTLGSVLTFVTPSAPTAATTVATSVTNSSASLNGTGNPNLSATNGWFRYSTTAPMACDDKFGSRAPVTGGMFLGGDIGDVPFSQSLSGLSAGTTYYYCAIVVSSEGTAYGAVLSFGTSGPATASTSAATTITATTATFTGSGNPNGATTVGWYRYSTTSPGTCNDTFGTRLPSYSGTSLGAGNGSVPFAQAVSGLSPGVTYYYCALASNSYGTGVGAVLSFATPTTGPTVTTYYASNLTKTTGLLNGYVNPGGDSGSGWFRYSTASPGTCNDTFGTRAPTTGGSPIAAGSSTVAYSQAVSGLTPATTYYFCAIGSNAMSSSWGTVQTFITPSAPTATTAPAASITTSSATLNGSGNPNRANANGWFRYAATNPGTCDDKFGSRAPITGGVALGGDIGDQAYNQAISGLSSGTTYYYCAIVNSSEGTAFGAVLPFTTSGASTATTAAATSISSTTATLNGAGNPNGAAAVGWYRYSNTSPGSCNDTFGTRTPSYSGTSLGAGTTNVAFAQAISGLSPGSTYYFCALTSNSYGTGLGAVLSFTTPAMAPTVSTYYASSLTRTTGVLNGYINPGGADTTGWFRYSTSSPGTCNDSFGTRAPTTGGSALGAGSANTAYTQAISGLLPATTYYFCAIGSNAVGTTLGSVLTFVTPSAPTVATTAASNLTNSSASLNGTGNPNLAATTGWFRYSTTAPMACDDKFGSRAPVMGGLSIGGDIGDQPFTQSISGLSAGTTYYYCAIVASTEGTAFGAVLSFVTSGAATATTTAATSITSSSATITGTGNPNGATAVGWFRYSSASPGSCNDTFGTRMPSYSGTSLGAGASSVAFAQSLTSLLPATTYYYCAIASNSYGTGFGTIQSFTTPAMGPTVSTYYASSLTRTTGILNGYANPGGADTTGWFRYSTSSPGTCNDTFGTRAPTTGGSAVGAGSSTVAYAQPMSGLTQATTYYFCAIASNAVGTTWGAVQTFITPSAPTALTVPASAITNTSATLNGTGNPNRAATTGWFRYSSTNPGTCDDKFGSRAPVTGGTSLGGDIGDQPFAQSVTGLSSGTYYYCAIVASTEGTAFGAVLSFTTSGAAMATTNPATSVTSTTATLNGSGNPNGATATSWFRYSATNPGSCTDTFGTRTPSSGGTALGAGTSNIAYGQAVNGLNPGVTYYYCAIANNSYGTGLGAVAAFTTPASPPTVSTDYPTGIATTLNGSANPNGAATTGWFRIATSSPGTCNDTFGTRTPTTGGTMLGAGASYVAFANPAVGLVPGTTYYYCAIASNAVGTSFGVVRAFTAPMPPTVSTLAATPVTATTATLNGSANPNGNDTIGWFRYSTSSPGTCNDVFGTRAPSASGTALGSGTTPTAVGQPISGLLPATTYYFCAIASSAYGTALGGVLSFTTPPNSSIKHPPTNPTGPTAPIGDSGATVTTLAATAVATDGAVLNGNANPNGIQATGWFRYATSDPGRCSDSFGLRAPDNSTASLGNGTLLGSGRSAVAFAQTLRGLAPATTYYFCAIAGSPSQPSFGAVLTVTTQAPPPTVSTKPASEVAVDSALLNASIIPQRDVATAWFRYGSTKPDSCSDSFGFRVPDSGGQLLGSGTSAVAASLAIAGLQRGTTYYYCAVASNAQGISYGELESFVPGVAPPVVVTLPATDVDPTSATIAGTIEPSQSPTTIWFRYGEFNPGSCDDSFGSRAAVVGDSPLGSDGPVGSSSVALSGLKPNATYYYCAAAQNLGGARFGQVRSFTTGPTTTASSLSSNPASDSPPAAAIDPQSLGGCTTSGRAPGSSPLALLTLLPLAALALRRRRRLA